MKKISIFALALILTASLTGCWRRKPAETTMPSTTAPVTQSTVPSVAPTTAPTVPSTNGTVPSPMPTDSILPDMEGTTAATNANGSDSTDHTAEGNTNSRSMTKY